MAMALHHVTLPLMDSSGGGPCDGVHEVPGVVGVVQPEVVANLSWAKTTPLLAVDPMSDATDPVMP